VCRGRQSLPLLLLLRSMLLLPLRVRSLLQLVLLLQCWRPVLVNFPPALPRANKVA
jgi:hypothetical protein